MPIFLVKRPGSPRTGVAVGPKPQPGPPSRLRFNLDLDVGLLMIVFGFLLPMFAPWIPIVNRIPRWIPLYKIIYRKWYHSTWGGQPPTKAPSEPVLPPSPR